MIPTTVSTLFGAPSSTPTSQPTRSSNPGAPDFGDMLSREMGDRQNTAPPQPSASDNNNSNRLSTNGSTNGSTNAPSSSNADSVNSRNRQEQTRQQNLQSKQNNGTEHADSSDSAAPTEPNSAAATDASTDAATTKSSDLKKTKSSDKDDANVATPATAADAQAGSASAALAALVNSLLPKAAVAITPSAAATPTTADALLDPKVAIGKSAASRQALAKDAATDTYGASDPAFDALVAQATQARDDSHSASLTLAADSRNIVAANKTIAFDPAAVLADTVKQNDPTVLTALPGLTSAVAASASHAPGQPIGNALTPSVGTAAWDDALSQKVVWMAAGGDQSASLTLNPPDLGPLQVVINVSNANADATFTAAQPEVRQALEAAMPKLREMLADAGIALGQANVQAGTPQQHNGGQSQNQSGRGSGDAASGDANDIAAVGRVRGPIISSGNGLVDTFA